MQSPTIKISLKQKTYEKFVTMAKQKDLSLSAFACSIIAEKIKSIPPADEPTKVSPQGACHA